VYDFSAINDLFEAGEKLLGFLIAYRFQFRDHSLFQTLA
jgi:hypothetical protein